MDAELRMIMTQIADEAATKAVKATLLTFGIDTKDPIETQRDMATLREIRTLLDDDEIRKDLIHIRRWRKTMDSIESKGLMAAMAMIVAGGTAIIIYAFKIKM